MGTVNVNWGKVWDWISDHFKEPASCVVCGGHDWDMLRTPWEMRQFQGPGLVIGSGSMLIVVALVCRDCKQALFFNITAIASAGGGT